MSNKLIHSQFVNKKQRIVQFNRELPAIVFIETKRGSYAEDKITFILKFNSSE